jgi:hypothetical protein
MPIRSTTSDADIARYLDESLKRLRQVAINNLCYLGETAIKEARENHRYKDRTGNLTSSIGYLVLDNGKVVRESSFEVARGVWEDDKGRKHPYSGDAGSSEGREFLHTLISEHSTGLVLILVAGMNYAAYVEAKNLNVLDSAEQLVERELPQLLKQLGYGTDR